MAKKGYVGEAWHQPPERVAKSRTIDGRASERAIGIAIIECAGGRTGTTVVFEEKEDAQVLGVHALEGLGSK